ncbi:hypothetical protein GCM10017752_36280 [Streptomyces roseoviridis]
MDSSKAGRERSAVPTLVRSPNVLLVIRSRPGEGVGDEGLGDEGVGDEGPVLLHRGDDEGPGRGPGPSLLREQRSYAFVTRRSNAVKAAS